MIVTKILNMEVMNSLPRWFGRKKSKDIEKKTPLEISEPFAPIHREGMSSISHSMASLTSISSENENLYVNGQVPRGQFKEYFMAPESQPDHKFLVPLPPRDNNKSRHVVRAGSVRSNVSHVSNNSSSVKRSSSIRSNVIITNSFLDNKKFVRHGSGRSSRNSSLLKKSLSMDDVLEESLDDRDYVNDPQRSYYNVQYLGNKKKTSSQFILNRENLQQHDQIYMNKLCLEGGTREEIISHLSGTVPDPLSTSYLGHTLLSQVEVPDKVEDSEDDSKDSGAVSMTGSKDIGVGPMEPPMVSKGGGRRSSLFCI